MKDRRNAGLIAAGVLIGLGIGVFFLAAITLIQSGQGAEEAAGGKAVPQVSAPLPDFALESLTGQQVSPADFRGQPILINFWATWCGPCRVEMPLFQRYAERYPDLKILAVNYDERPDVVQKYVEDMGLTFTVLLDQGGNVGDAFRVRAFPTTYFVDKEGIIQAQHIGQVSENQLAGYLEKLGVIE